MLKKKFLTEAEVSEITGRAVSTLRNDRHFRQGIPFIKWGRMVRYDFEEVVTFLEGKKIRTSETL